MLGWFTGLGTAVKLGIVGGILLLFVGATWYIHHSIFTSGYTAAEAKLKPQIAKLTTDLTNANHDLDEAVRQNAVFQKTLAQLTVQLREQNQAMQKLEADSLTAQAEARSALARVATNQQRYTAEIVRLKAIVSGPPITEGDSEQADIILRTLLRDRMPVRTGAAPPATDRGAAGGDDSRARDAAVRVTLGFADSPDANSNRPKDRQQSPGGSGSGTRLASAR